METRTNWVIVLVASSFAVLVIGIAAVAASYQPTPAAVAPLTAEQGTTPQAPASDDWRAAVSSLAPQSEGPDGEYRAPKELGATDAIFRELMASYFESTTDGNLTVEERDAAVAEVLQRNIQAVVAPTMYTLADVSVDPSGSIQTYAGQFTEALARSTQIKEYELTSFARTVGQGNARGTVSLQDAAAIYKGIEKELASMSVPGAVAQEHLAVLKSITQIAYVTSLLGSWSGEPTQALSFIDAFVRAERDVQLTLYNAYRKMSSVVEHT